MDQATIRDMDVAGKRVLVRVDFNVPLEGGRVTDDSRIRAALPTLRYLLDRGAALILMSHLGRPKGKPRPEFSLAPVAEHLARLLGRPVQMAPDCVGEAVAAMARTLQPGQVLMLENLRFHPEEEANDPDFAARLAALGEIYVNDAFGAAHRAHASTQGVARYLPALAGFCMESELTQLGSILTSPDRPFVVVLGGAKVSDKLGVLESLVERADRLLIGGGMAFTFLAARGLEVGSSLCERELLEKAREIEEKASGRGVQLVLPVDVVVAARPEPGIPCAVVAVDQIPAGQMGLDIGPRTVEIFRTALADARTVFWNGPMGVFEVPPFDRGTLEVARAVAASQARSVVGGGDSVAALHQTGLADQITHVSTGGGASLEFLEGRELPGVAALWRKDAVAR
ncbi:MAG TPA: phosphoglycerate kinase [Candidatus Nitrosotenuis sp.]|jgi:phosphoglycerate kinase|nr:phosphoglycerate kinase [Candidatus Nitrosotenuis sp.]